MPERIQMSRQHAWKADSPEAIIVARPHWLGNPFGIYEHCKGKDGDWGVQDRGRLNAPMGHGWTRHGAAQVAVDAYRRLIEDQYPVGGGALYGLVQMLAGRDLACWCPLDQPCHADVLLELANPKEAPDA